MASERETEFGYFACEKGSKAVTHRSSSTRLTFCVMADYLLNIANMELVNNEIRCFPQSKAKLMTFEDLVKISCDLYTLDEAVTAQAVLSKYVSDLLT